MSLASFSFEMRPNSADARCNCAPMLSSVSIAYSRCAERTSAAPSSSEPNIQASRIALRMLVDRPGALVLPVRSLLSAASRSRFTLPASIAYCRRRKPTSMFGLASNAVSQCSSSTWKWVRVMHTRMASSTSVVRHVWFSFSMSARGETAIDGSGYTVGGMSVTLRRGPPKSFGPF